MLRLKFRLGLFELIGSWSGDGRADDAVSVEDVWAAASSDGGLRAAFAVTG